MNLVLVTFDLYIGKYSFKFFSRLILYLTFDAQYLWISTQLRFVNITELVTDNLYNYIYMAEVFFP